jgi:hypothetical protein
MVTVGYTDRVPLRPAAEPPPPQLPTIKRDNGDMAANLVWV